MSNLVNDVRLQIVSGFFDSLNSEKTKKSPTLLTVAKNLGYKSTSQVKKSFPTIEEVHQFVCQNIVNQIEIRIKGVASQHSIMPKDQLVLTMLNSLLSYVASNRAIIRLLITSDVEFLSENSLQILRSAIFKLELSMVNFLKEAGFVSNISLPGVISTFFYGLLHRMNLEIQNNKNPHFNVNLNIYYQYTKLFVDSVFVGKY